MDTLERARRYVAAMPAAQSGAGGHNATFAVACALVKGFDLPISSARAVLYDFNARCSPPWSEKDLEHKLTQADKAADPEPRGYLIGKGERVEADATGSDRGPKRVWSAAPKPKYDPVRLREFAGPWADEVDLVWLANRSAVDPADVSSEDFLGQIYRSDEKVLCFTEVNKDGNPWTQGEAVWPAEEPPKAGKCGVWYLAQPVDGEYHLNPRSGKTSRRSEEAVTRWPFLVLESDEAPLREWLGALARLPLRIVAIYTSGGRSVHALVRIDATTKGHWDDLVKRQMAVGLSFLVMNGADKGVFSAVRLTRLPGAWREGKMKGGRYERFPRPERQKLLYLCPDAQARPLCEQPARRDVEAYWCETAAKGPSDADADGSRWVRDGLAYYARVSERCRAALRVWEGGEA
jgi:hypothetical protein